jgi:hypothetical protein
LLDGGRGRAYMGRVLRQDGPVLGSAGRAR